MPKLRVHNIATSLDGYASGVATIRAYLRAGLVDEMHVAVVPVLLGGGERLLDPGPGGGLRKRESRQVGGTAHQRDRGNPPH